MLQQIDIYTKATDVSELYSDLSVKIHGFIMSRIDTNYAEELHSNGVNPFAIYTVDAGDYYITRVSVLNERASEIFSAFEDRRKIRVFGTSHNLEILDISVHPPVELADVVKSLSKRKYKISFVTPAMYKQNGEQKCNPDFSVYFNSVVQKLMQFENITYGMEDVRKAVDLMRVDNYSLQMKSFKTGSKTIKGMTGELEITLPREKEYADLLTRLLAYATFSGIGGQTTQGMGGVVLEPIVK